MDKPGFKIRGEFYPSPESFRFEDTVLVRELTGMRWPEFARALDEMQLDGEFDPTVVYGLIAVAVAQVNRGWRRQHVIKFCSALEMNGDDVEMVGGESEGDAGPPEESGAKILNFSDSESSTSPDESLESTSQTSIGSPGLEGFRAFHRLP